MKKISKNSMPKRGCYKYKNIHSYVSVLLAIAVLNLSISCSYYNVRTIPTTKEKVLSQIEEFNTSNKYIVIHSNDKSWHLKGVVINEDTQTISGDVLTINSEHQYKKPRYSKKTHRFYNKKTKPFDELHFNLKTPQNFKEHTKAEILLSNIESVSVNDKNTGRTIVNVFLGTVGTIFAVTLIVFALKSSCPFIYIKNGEEFDFVGELYPGIITAKMQKDDFLPLPEYQVDENNEYILSITNQLKEIQHTDQVQLISVNHDENIEVLLDKKGQVQTFQNITAPTKIIVDGNTEDIAPSLTKDNIFYAFNTSINTPKSTRNLILEFDKPKKNTYAKLYLTAKNSVWLDFVFGKFNEQFGAYYKAFQKNQQEIEADSIQKWLNSQNIPLSVYVKKGKEWQLIEQINTVGPMAMRNMVIPIKMEDIKADKLQVKLETGFMFWEVDYAGVDFSENEAVKINYLNPYKAIDQDGNDVVDLLLYADDNYFVQPNIGDEVTISFLSKSVKKSDKQSIFLKNRGYYNYIRDYKGVPDFEYLKSFREDNTFTRFSEKAYFDFVNFDLKTLTYNE